MLDAKQNSGQANSAGRKPEAVTPTVPPYPRSLLRTGWLRGLGAVCVTGLLAACATQPRPAVPVAQEVAQYRAHAKSYYAPPGPPEDPWGPYIQEAAQRFDVPGAWIRAVMNRESNGKLFTSGGALVTSGPGAMGLMQLMPPTYDELSAEYSLGSDPYNPHDNILAGAAYIRQMYDIYGSPGFLAAYNGGPGRLDDFVVHNRTLPKETRNYVAAIGRQIEGIYPTTRSQADLMVASHAPEHGVAYASVHLSDEAKSVQAAWAHRNHTPDAHQDDQPVQVADASSEPEEAAPAYTRSWTPVGHASAVQATAPMVASASGAENVRSAWANRIGGSKSPEPQAPVEVASAAVVEPRRLQLHFVTPAMAEPAPLMRHGSGGTGTRNWAVQVGAFGSSALASQAAGHAQNKFAGLSSARPVVASVSAGHAKLYRARLTGLSHDAAVEACHRLSQSGQCVVVSPDTPF